MLVVCFYESNKEEHAPTFYFLKPYQACEEEMLHLAYLDLFHLEYHMA